MKRLILPLFLIALLASCASVGPTGTWDYSVTGTPQGDYTGIMTVTRQKVGYVAKMNGQQAGEIAFEKFSFDKKSKLSKGLFYFSGAEITFSAAVTKEQMKGSMSTSGMDFPFLATRKK